MQILGFVAFAILLVWVIRRCVRAELELVGLFRAERDLTEKEMQEIMTLMSEGKFNRAESLHDRYRYGIRRKP